LIHVATDALSTIGATQKRQRSSFGSPSFLRWPTPLWWLRDIFAIQRLPAPMLLENSAEKKLHLRIDAPHVVVGPAPQGGKDLRIEP